MKRFVVVAVIFATSVVFSIYFLSADLLGATKFFADKIRPSLFAGLLTVGSFLLSLKVFIIVKLKETVFDSTEYKIILANLRKINPKIEHYAQVRNLSSVLFLSISSAIYAAGCQLTIGLIEKPLAMMICVFLAAFAAAMLLQTLILIRKILNEWLDHLEVKPAHDHDMVPK
jgi:hypothetical protein